MNKQNIFKFKFPNKYNESNFYVNSTNIEAYNGLFLEDNNSVFLIGPRKSGKSFLAKMWLNNNESLIYKKNLKEIISVKKNVIVEDIDNSINQEDIFHIINHCNNNKLKILISASIKLNKIDITLPDLYSRLQLFKFLYIHQPDDDMLLNILTKLFIEKQFIINSFEIFDYILNRANRSYDNMIKIVKELDTLSLEKKRQLTIPLIKEIL